MEVRIYYEDTDAGGVVYHSNYISYMERARTEFLRKHGLSVREMHDMGIIFPVVSIEANFRAPARLDDLLEVRTQIAALKNSSFTAAQQVVRKDDGKLLVEAKVTLACVNPEMKPRRLPQEIRDLFSSLMNETP
ncbi:4-hydroxybenzoyl-CoA thioesterase family active site [Citrifermentans bremense]|uniref:Acyl-CoA thioesterase n=2 Tax=Geobacteraceae TaxID=213422 RepID=A0ABQ0MNP6_9BACT|nr:MULTISPECIES: tol-pal system-associated acyl-CoA thioesterase [Geobacteraceae]BCG48801.1 4-hydroxybenzoyl-CoA thioesterase family active site [Citrifermentans bremense]GAW68696.1 acyl-CoA thioesterase [Geoanaerobacter pelophilus]